MIRWLRWNMVRLSHADPMGILVSATGLMALGLLVWVIVWAATQPNGGCPPHTVSTVTGWMPVSTGKSVVLVPRVECVKQ